jgi:hypothetical protein
VPLPEEVAPAPDGARPGDHAPTGGNAEPV